MTTKKVYRTDRQTPDKVIPMCRYASQAQTDRQTPDKVIPMCHYALQATQKDEVNVNLFNPLTYQTDIFRFFGLNEYQITRQVSVQIQDAPVAKVCIVFT